ncbi:AbfB domain-containing protein [Paenibacillus hamazuiensis]|uniref:AbfB domain-containing protein n=1 Tax=Paenibacillus hamazuiensis TaxID=2936508 RepID=UPI00200BD324|nr:AbfB domain-containing protein [Paenibacillus hamazuiensis]
MKLNVMFRNFALVVLMLTLLFPGAVALPKNAHAAVSDLDLAYRWAPLNYHDTDSSDYEADYLTAVDYDGDWNTLNNWENLHVDHNRLIGKAYYSVVETSTHWFIGYNYFHPRDWTDVDFFGLDQHENDSEGILLSVRKDGSDYGTLEAMVTVSHTDFFSFTPAGSPLKNGQETIDGTVRMLPYDGYDHPVIFQEAKGHGIKAWDGNLYTNTDVLLYYPSKTTGEVPSGGNDRDVKYQLVDIFAPQGLWDHRFDPQTFALWGTHYGDNGQGPNMANASWGYDDKDDKVPRGYLALDPASLISNYFSNLGNFSTTYTKNPFTAGKVNRIEASNISDAFIRHASGRGRIDSGVSPAADAEWRIVKGLADPNAISFESVNFPGEFLRHKNGEIWREPYSNNALYLADATFYKVPGLADSNLASFESYNFPGRYIRHRNSLLYSEAVSSDLDRRDATFIIR